MAQHCCSLNSTKFQQFSTSVLLKTRIIGFPCSSRCMRYHSLGLFYEAQNLGRMDEISTVSLFFFHPSDLLPSFFLSPDFSLTLWTPWMSRQTKHLETQTNATSRRWCKASMQDVSLAPISIKESRQGEQWLRGYNGGLGTSSRVQTQELRVWLWIMKAFNPHFTVFLDI